MQVHKLHLKVHYPSHPNHIKAITRNPNCARKIIALPSRPAMEKHCHGIYTEVVRDTLKNVVLAEISREEFSLPSSVRALP